MIAAVRIYRDGKGNWQPHDVLLNYSRPQSLDEALERVRAGRTTFVRPEDAAAVLAEVTGEHGGQAKIQR